MPLDFEIHHRTLDNGLQVVVAPDPSVPIVAVNLWVGVGSRHEQPGRTGLAHLFEHLMFQGSRNVAEGEHMQVLMGNGGRLNATTWFDRTNYFETVPTGVLELALWLEADRHGHLLDAVTQENLDNQRDVVKEEKQQRYDDRPYGHALQDVYEHLFPQGHPYHHSTIGSMADLDAATLDDVHAFFASHYGPNNTAITLVGDVTAQQGFDLVERYFGGLPRVEIAPTPPCPALEPLDEPVRFERVGDVPEDRLYLAFRLPADHRPEFDAADAAFEVLCGLATSRLYRTAVRRDELATSISRSVMGLVGGNSIGMLIAEPADGHTVEEVEDAICAELERLAVDPPTDAELDALRADLERTWLQSLSQHDERADLICQYTLLYDDPQYVNTYLDGIRALTADQIRAAAQRWLQPRSRVAIVHRKGESA